MTMDLAPATEADFYWEFAVAEVLNDKRHGFHYARHLEPSLLRRLRAAERYRLTRSEEESIRSAVLSSRPTYLRGLMSPEMRWYRGRLRTRELLAVKIPRLNLYTPFAPSRALSEFVAALDAGHLPRRTNFGTYYRRLRPRFDPAHLAGRPILVARRRSGPYVVVEGLTRLSVLVSKVVHREKVPARVPVLLGLSSRLSEWRFS